MATKEASRSRTDQKVVNPPVDFMKDGRADEKGTSTVVRDATEKDQEKKLRGTTTDARSSVAPATKIGGNDSGFIDSLLARDGTSTKTSGTTSEYSSTTRSLASAIVNGFPTDKNSVRKNEQIGYHPITIVTTDGRIEGPSRVVPIVPHHHHEEHEVIEHSQRRAGETTSITIPTTTFQSAKMASIRQGVTYTEDKELTIRAPLVAAEILPNQRFSFGGGTNADIKATTVLQVATDVAVNDKGPEEYARYRAKVEELARKHELETSQKAAVYREQVEKDAAAIRQILERQHIRDIEFRKEMLEAAVDRQSLEIQLEAEYALRALNFERDAARAALEAARMSTDIDVNIESAVGLTRSQGSVTTTSEARVESQTGNATSTTVKRDIVENHSPHLPHK